MKPITAPNLTFAFSYKAMERFLVDLVGGSTTSVASRFRKLRPRFAADALQTRTGNWVEYDLPRIFSIGAIYNINALGIPQGHATDIVLSNWPEVARGCLAAAAELEIMEKPEEMPADAEPRVYFGIDAFSPVSADDGGIVSWATNAAANVPGLHVALDCRPIIGALQANSREDDIALLNSALLELDRTFGWLPASGIKELRLPRRTESAFFGQGPYFDRALALLDAAREGDGRREQLQAFLDYIERPSPIDGWKQAIGTTRSAPRLAHILSAVGRKVGLRSSSISGEVLTLAAGKEAEARSLIDAARKVIADDLN